MTHDYSGEDWKARRVPPDSLAAPGQMFPPERYTERFKVHQAEARGPFKGVTANGRVEPGLFPLATTGVSTRPLREAAEVFLATLTQAQRATTIFPVDAPEWRLWHGLFTRQLRHGMCVEDMNAAQREAAFNLLRATLSARGFALAQDIRRTNQLAGELSGRYVDLGADVFWLSIMGEPGGDAPWGWQFDGHHININCFIVGDQMVLTPTFLGAEPTTVKTGPYAGIDLFRAEEADGLAVMQALSETQRRQAIVGDKLEIDFFTGFFRDNFELKYQGARVGEFSAAQRDLVMKVVADYVGVMRPGHAEVRLDEVRRRLDDAWFGWIGGQGDGAGFYYRVHSPVILIEFSHVPGIGFEGDAAGPNHVHTLVRTPNGNDYGRDLLRQHLERDHPKTVRNT